MRPAPRLLSALACAALAIGAGPERWVDPVVEADSLRAPATARVTAIKAHDEGVRTAIVVEATEPVAYVTTEPDPVTVLVDLRNATAEGALNDAVEGTGHIAGVTLETVTAADGQTMARVRVRMRGLSAHRVRSARNLILIEVDRAKARTIPETASVAAPVEPPMPVAAPAAPAEPAVKKPAATVRAARAAVSSSVTLQRVRATASARAVSVVLSGTGRLEASSVHEVAGDVPRLVLDFPGVAPATPPTTWVSQEPVDKIRVALNQRAPALTRVVIDLVRRAPYRIETDGRDGKDVRIVFEKSPGAGPAQGRPAPASRAPAVATGQAPVDLMSALAAPASADRAVPVATPPREPDPIAPLEGRTTPLRVQPAPTINVARIPATAPVPPPYVVIAAPERMTPMAGGIWSPADRMVTATPPLPEPVAASEPAAPVVPIEAPVTASDASAAAAQQIATAPVPPAGASAPAAQQTMVPAQIGQPGAERAFTGHPVSLDFQGADLRAVLRTFAEISGLNLVIDPSVTGSVDVTLRDVPWDQALDLILKANKLGYVIDGTIVRIAPLSVLADEEVQRRKLAEEQALAGTLNVVTVPLSYARAEDIRTLITRSALTPRGEVEVDVRTNTLIIRDLPAALQVASDLIAKLDTPQPQVEIEARIVQTNRDFARSLGVQWGFSGRMAPELGNTLPLSFPNQGSLSGRTGGVQGPPGQPSEAAATAVNLGVQGASSAIGLSIGSVNGAINLDVALSALERSGKGRLLSTPRVSTQNNVEAEITQGVQIPIQTVANNTVTVTFKDAALTLKVVPQITASGTVIMRIAVENATPDFTRSVNNIPPINTQRAFTQVLVKDGDTTVIGGIYVSSETSQNDRTPGLHRVPLLGWLFKRDSVTDESRELLIFITPRIISS